MQDSCSLVANPPDASAVLASLPDLDTIEGTDILAAQTRMLLAWSCCENCIFYLQVMHKKLYMYLHGRLRRADARAEHREKKGNGKGRGKGRGKGGGKGSGTGGGKGKRKGRGKGKGRSNGKGFKGKTEESRGKKQRKYRGKGKKKGSRTAVSHVMSRVYTILYLAV